MARKPPVRTRDAESTRAEILAAARRRFASDGYERTTMRAVAGDVGVDPAMVIRYFGNKEKLFAEAAEFDLRLPGGSTRCEEVGATLVGHFVDRWEADDTFMALLRVAMTNEAAAEQVKSVLQKQVSPTVAAFVPERSTVSLRAGLVASQLLGMALCRYVLRLPPVAAMRREDVVAWLAPTVQRYVTAAKP